MAFNLEKQPKPIAEQPDGKKCWEIKSITPTLKVIHLTVSYKGLTKRVYFYKSKYIKNNETTDW